MACVGGVYSVAPFRRTADDVLNEILRKEKQEERPEPQNKRLRAVLTRQVDDTEVNAKDEIFDWLAKEVQQRDPQEERTVVAIMDGEKKLRSHLGERPLPTYHAGETCGCNWPPIRQWPMQGAVIVHGPAGDWSIFRPKDAVFKER